MKNKVTTLILLMVPLFIIGQTIDNFDAEPEAGYWGYEISENADSTLSFVDISYVADPVTEGSGAMQLDYSAHNIEAWGGYAKIFHMLVEGDDEPGSPIEGTWKLAPIAGALMVGPAANDGSWWSNTEDDVALRACYFDDEYVFGADGSFSNVLGTETWIEGWQGGTDACGAPVAPHDGSNAASWEYNTGTGQVTLNGVGAYLGLAKAWNGGELGSPGDAPESITYNITLSGNDMTLVIEAGAGVFWTFQLMQVSGSGSPIEGAWKLAPIAGALMVGPAANDGSWWSNTEDDVALRACYFDDEYVFGADGSFSNVLGTETWIEGWQGGTDACGAPVAPHDGSNAASWEYNTGTGQVTLNGVGAYLGLAKAWNGGELGSPGDAPESITYDATLSGGTMTLVIEAGAGVFWTFKLVQAGSALAQANDWGEDWMTILETRSRDGELWDWSGYDSLSFSYYNSVPQSEENRVHLRLNLSDFGNIVDPANYTGLGEYYYSFHYILDSEPGWNTVSIPLVRNDDWAGGGFNLTGWSGDAGNGELDKHAIAGFHLEFSISGGGDGDYVGGTIVLDDFKLTGSQNVLTNPGFELTDTNDDGAGWGGASGGETAHVEVVTDASEAHSGDNYLHIGVQDNWAVYYTEDVVPAQFGETWRLSGFAKSISGVDGDFAAFKFEAKDDEGTVVGTTGDVYLSITDEWSLQSLEYVMPEGATQVTAVIVASRWDGAVCDYIFDDMFLMSMGVLDVIPPDAVQNVAAVSASNYNLVTWVDNEGEEGETYNVYASTEPITDSLSLSQADVVATNVLEGSQAAVHYLHTPLTDSEVTYYYAVACKDASNNVGVPGSSEGSITNAAKGVPTISLAPPAEFAADGDLSEWYDSGIVPFELGATDNSYGTPHLGFGEVADDNDLYGTIWTAVDNDYFYVAAEIVDDVVNTDDSGGWWTADVVQLCFGFYNQQGPKHVGQQRGAEPDYKIYFTPSGANSDNGAGVLAEHGDGNYFHEVYNPDYVFEFRISLDDILIEDDVRLTPSNGMRTPFEPMVYDNDGDGLEAIMVLSPTNDDNAHQTCEVWSNTWIGDQSTMGADDNGVVAYEFALHQNYPNPFNPTTKIQFAIPKDGNVNLSVYNMLGAKVGELVNKALPMGNHEIVLNANRMASGIYFYKLESNGRVKTQKMILLK